MMSELFCFSAAIALNHRYASSSGLAQMRNGVLNAARTLGDRRASAAASQTGPLELPSGSSAASNTLDSFQIGKGALIGEVDILYSDAVLSGPEHTQLISALGNCFRRLYTIARSVASLPRLPAPKCPNRAILCRARSGLI